MKSQGCFRSLPAIMTTLLAWVLTKSFIVSTQATSVVSFCLGASSLTGQQTGRFGASTTIQNTNPSVWSNGSLFFTSSPRNQTIPQPDRACVPGRSDRHVAGTDLDWNSKGAVDPGLSGTRSSGGNRVSTPFTVNGSICNGVITTTPTSVSSTPASRSGITPTQGTQTVITHGNPKISKVALTFDDGPGQYTQQVLAILQQYNVKATFFLIGQQIKLFPALLQQDLAAGNAVGNHSFTHPDLTTLSFSAILRELRDTQNAVMNRAGTCMTIFRPPFGAYNTDVLTAASQLGLTIVTWSAVANDWDNPQPSADLIASRILSAAGNGAIFLLHEGGGNRANTVAALPVIIEGLLARGLRPVTIPQMLADLSK